MFTSNLISKMYGHASYQRKTLMLRVRRAIRTIGSLWFGCDNELGHVITRCDND